MVWITAAEALAVFQVLPQTLYANVSRGKVRARPDDLDPRRSLYHRDDVLRMTRRSNGRRKVDAVSAQAMQYGDPVLSTALSTAAGGRLLYRGHDAAELANTASLEDAAALLWGCEPALIHAAMAEPATLDAAPARLMAPPAGALAAALLALAQRSAAHVPAAAGRAVDTVWVGKMRRLARARAGTGTNRATDTTARPVCGTEEGT